MGDDIHVTVPPPVEEPEEDDTYERAGEELVALLTAQAERLGECIARLSELETRLIQIEQREYASPEHSHDGFAETGHGHVEYAPTEHTHETERTTPKEPDRPPEKQHPYFRKLSDL